MAVNSDSKHYFDYFDHVLNNKKIYGTTGKVYDIINDISNRQGLGEEFQFLDGDIQDDIIDAWIKIIET